MPGPRQKPENASALAIPQRGNPGSCQNKTGAPGCNPGSGRPNHRRTSRICGRLYLSDRARMQNCGTAGIAAAGHGPGRPEHPFCSGNRRLRNDRRSLLFRDHENFRRGDSPLGRLLRFRSCGRAQLPAVSAVGAAQTLDPFCQRLRNLKDCMTVGAFNAHSINPFDSRLRSGLA